MGFAALTSASLNARPGGPTELDQRRQRVVCARSALLCALTRPHRRISHRSPFRPTNRSNAYDVK
eukprot:2294184-Prymnesium_polylepis.1